MVVMNQDAMRRRTRAERRWLRPAIQDELCYFSEGGTETRTPINDRTSR
ncbi:hypothetical protein N183_31070 [Sinorhizobium sp. Sb3]|nr:hypothetical protein N183_31070 [Sinorhizobium sp. Sb3]